MVFNCSYAVKKWHDGRLSFMCLEKGLQGLKKRGGLGGAQPPPICKHDACVMGFDRSYAICLEKSGMMGFNPSYALKKPARLQEAGALGGGRSPPPMCKHNARMMAFNRSYVLKFTSTAKKGGEVGGGGRSPPPPPFANTMLASWASIAHMP